MKTVAANDIIGLLDDVASYTLVKDLNLPAGSANAGTTLRYANSSTGAADDTRASRITLDGGGSYRINQTGAVACYADLIMQNTP